jgi:hypothetical protein
MYISEDHYSQEVSSIAQDAVNEGWDEASIDAASADHPLCKYPRCLFTILWSPNKEVWFDALTAELFTTAAAGGSHALYEEIARFAFRTDIEMAMQGIREDEREQRDMDGNEGTLK